jgi:hypothetical protein
MAQRNLWLVMLVFALALGMMACGNTEGDPELEGTISIIPNPYGAYINLELTAEYTGDKEVSYQWKRGGTAISGAIDKKYIPPYANDYTVTVSAGDLTKTSAIVTVTAMPYAAFLGTWKNSDETIVLTHSNFRADRNSPDTYFELNINAADGWTPVPLPSWAGPTVTTGTCYKLTGTVDNTGYFDDEEAPLFEENGLYLILTSVSGFPALYISRPDGEGYYEESSNTPAYYTKR